MIFFVLFFFQWAEKHKVCERLKLQDLLARPLQRLAKYPLLIKAILVKTEAAEVKTELKDMVRLQWC